MVFVYERQTLKNIGKKLKVPEDLKIPISQTER